jgi:hypothetical protein
MSASNCAMMKFVVRLQRAAERLLQGFFLLP